MPRLVTFGCSYTYGHGLPDCHIKPDHPGDQPSKYAWPQLLAHELKRECLNLSEPGSGNFQILMNVLRTKFEPDDLVIIGYSYFTRFKFYQMADKVDRGYMIQQDHPAHKQVLLEDLNFEHWDKKVYWDNWLAIQHVELLLNSQGIQNFSFLSIPLKEPKPNLIKLDNFISDIQVIYRDKALDDKHPGLESHRQQSLLILDKIYDKISA